MISDYEGQEARNIVGKDFRDRGYCLLDLFVGLRRRLLNKFA